jgi:peptide/nickel transport system permease protein
MKSLTIWDRLGRAIRDQSFIIGAILVTFFILTAVLGPELAPHNPFYRDRVQIINGEMQSAPFAPSDLYPLGTDDQGRDMLSLLLYGARQTLVIAFVAMIARLLLGLVLGTISGWWPGGLFDRAVTAVTEFMAAIPALILAILLVFAIGIRRGQVTFIIALSLVGWGEIAQIVRSHVIVIRNRLFILASRAVGLGSGEILSRHVLPNLLATLLALAALEMGGVLLLQGELGFIHIFVGGGGTYITDAMEMGQVIHYFEIPDWGAMLGTSWAYFRSLPWLPMAPALAFFVTIVGFNLFGFGLQRFIEKGRFHPSGWSVLRFFAIVGVVLWGAQALLASSSLEAQYTKIAREFDLQRAWNDISYLAQSALEGRPTGPGSGYQAAAYISQQFEEIGLTPLTNGTYYQGHTANVAHVTAPPVLEILGEDGGLLFDHATGIGFDPVEPFSTTREVEAELVVMANTGAQNPVEDPSGSILLFLDPGATTPGVYRDTWDWAGVLRMVSDAEWARGREYPINPGMRGPISYPTLLISESAARQLLASAGMDLDDLQAIMATGEQMVIHTGLHVNLTAGTVYQETEGANVVGYLPAADTQTEGDRVLVVARYAGYPARDGVVYPGADEDTSGVAVMLEVARAWRDQGFEPKRTVVFAAVDEGGARYLGNHPILPTASEDTWTVVIISGVGAGDPELHRLEVGGDLARPFDDSARRFGVDTNELENWYFFFTPVRPREAQAGAAYWNPNPGFSGLVVVRPGDDLSGTPADTLDHLEPELLSESGQVISHYLMVISSR